MVFKRSNEANISAHVAFAIRSPCATGLELTKVQRMMSKVHATRWAWRSTIMKARGSAESLCLYANVPNIVMTNLFEQKENHVFFNIRA